MSSFSSVLTGKAARVGFLSGAAYGLAARLAVSFPEWGGAVLAMTLGFLFVVPITIGYLTVRPVVGSSARFKFFAPWVTCALVILGSVLVGLEGAICVVFAAPAMLLLASLGGFMAGAQPTKTRVDIPIAIFLPWVVMGFERGTPGPTRHVVTTTQIEIAAPASVVWPLVVSVDSIRDEERRPAFFTAIGFPRPIAATLDHPGVGGVRTASFDRGVVFREAVIEWVPERRLRFTIDARAVPRAALDPHVTIGGPFFDVLTGTYELEPVSPARTVLVLRSEHRVSTRFNVYAAWWADRVMASVQRNILAVLKERAETGWATRRLGGSAARQLGGSAARRLGGSATRYRAAGSGCRLSNSVAHRSPFAARRAAIVRSVKVCGPTAPPSTSSHVQGADTGAPVFGRTAYGAA